METVSIRLYEGLFLVDSDLAASDWDKVNSAIRRILERSDAEIVSMKKWDERRLAYEIQGKSRGTYILTYFNVAGDKIGAIERDVQLSESIMRVLIVSRPAGTAPIPDLSGDEVEEADDAEKTLAEAAPAVEVAPVAEVEAVAAPEGEVAPEGEAAEPDKSG